MEPFLPPSLRFRFLVLFSIVFLLGDRVGVLGGNPSTDPCEALWSQLSLSASSFGPYLARPSAFRKCLDAFPLDKKKAGSILDSVRKTLRSVYVYENIATNYSAPYTYSHVDAKKELQRINKTAWKTERAFHDALYNLTISFNDAHLVYYSQCFHRAPQSFMIFPLISFLNSTGKLGIKISPDLYSVNSALISATESVMGRNISVYANADVIRIDGAPAVDYLLQFADKYIGKNQDLAGRFNCLFSRYQYVTLFTDPSGLPMGKSFKTKVIGDFALRLLIPYKDTVDLVVKRVGNTKSELIKVPWFVAYEGQPFKNSKDYYALNCMLSSTPNSQKSKQTSDPHRNIRGKLNAVVPRIAVEDHMIQKSAVDDTPSNCVYNGYIKAFVLPRSTKTGVVVIPSFIHINESIWKTDFVQAFLTLKKKGCSKFILEMSTNPGGFVFLGLLATKIMFPSKLPYYPHRIRGSDLISKMVVAARDNPDSLFSYGIFADLNNKPFKSPKGFYFPIEKLTYGGIPDNYSRPFKDWVSGLEPVKNFPVLTSKNLIVLTNGLCYSSCGLVATLLKELCGVKIATTGGLPERPMAFGAVAGGAVIELSDFSKELRDLGLEALAGAPQPFPSPAYLTFTWRMTYGNSKPKIPLDYVFQSADLHIPYTQKTVLNETAVWSAVAVHFEQ